MLNDLTLSQKKFLNFQILLTSLILFIGDILYKLIYDISIFKVIFDFLNYNFFLFVISIIILGYLHEILHSIAYIVFGKANFKDISMGFDFKSFCFYTDCPKFFTANKYRLILSFPLIIIGILPFCFGVIFQNLYLATIGLVLVASSSADIIYLILIKNIPSDTLIKTPEKSIGFITE